VLQHDRPAGARFDDVQLGVAGIDDVMADVIAQPGIRRHR
jgi:hypothetical protein